MKQRFLPLLMALLLIVSLGLLAFGYFEYTVALALREARQIEQEDDGQALARYRELAAYLRTFSLLAGRFEEEYSQAMIGQLRLLYRGEEYDQVIDLADSCVQEDVRDLAAAYFWSGNAFFQRGMNEDVGEDAFSWYHRAQAQYLKALEHDSEGRWSIRFNYELVRTALEQSEQEGGRKPLKVLRPTEEDVQQTNQKIEG